MYPVLLAEVMAQKIKAVFKPAVHVAAADRLEK